MQQLLNTTYGQDVQQISKYLSINGMFEQKQGQQIFFQNSINNSSI